MLMPLGPTNLKCFTSSGLSSAFSDSNTLLEFIVFEAPVSAVNNIWHLVSAVNKIGHPHIVPFQYTPSGNYCVTLIDFITLFSV